LSSRLDVLILNAGIMAIPPGTTSDGYESQVGTNYLGHALLMHILLPTLLKTAELTRNDSRIVVLSSVAHSWTPKGGIAFESLKTNQENVSTVARYGQSKLASILFVREMGRRYSTITAVAVDPGTVKTDLSKSARESSFVIRVADNVISSIVGVSAAEGAWNTLWSATNNRVQSGVFYSPVGKKAEGSRDSANEVLAKQLWEWTTRELQV
jgi:retinol dehydrogenase-12